MAVTYVASSSLVQVSVNPPSVNLTLPTLQADDLIIIRITSRNITLVDTTNKINTPTGYTEFGAPRVTIDAAANADDMHTAVFYKRAVAGDSGATVTCSRGGTSTLDLFAIARVWRGVDWTNGPFDATAPAKLGDITVDNDVDFPAFDPTATDVHVVYDGWHADDLTTATNFTNDGTTFTVRNDTESAAGSDATAVVWSADRNGNALAAISPGIGGTAGSSIGYVYGLLPAAQDRRGIMGWAEMEVPDEPRRGQISWAEMEVPNEPRRGQVSWVEMEVPDEPRRAQISWSELEIPNEPRRAQISWIELEVPDVLSNDRRGLVSWVEMEVPDEPRRGLISWAELETPDEPRRGQVGWAEMEVPDEPRRARISWAELEIPDVPTTNRRALIDRVSMEVPQPLYAWLNEGGFNARQRDTQRVRVALHRRMRVRGRLLTMPPLPPPPSDPTLRGFVQIPSVQVRGILRVIRPVRASSPLITPTIRGQIRVLSQPDDLEMLKQLLGEELV